MADERLEQNKAKEDDLLNRGSQLGASTRDLANASRQTQEEVVQVTGGLTDEEVAFEPEPLEYTNDLEDIKAAIQVLPAGHSNAYLNDKALELSLIQMATNDRIDPQTAFEDSLSVLTGSSNVLQTIQAHQTLYSKNLTEQLRTFAQQEIQRHPESLTAYQSTLANLDLTESTYDGLVGVQKILTDKYSKEDPLSRAAREKEASGFAYSLFREYSEGRNVWDKVVDVGGMIIDPMSFTFDANSLITKIDPDFKGTPAEGLDKIVAGYQLLDPELKTQVFPELLQMATTAYDDNEFKIAGFIGLLHDPSFATSTLVETSIDVVEAGTIVAAPLTGAYRVAKSLHKGSSIRQTLKAKGNPEAAVDVTKKKRSEVDEAMDADATEWEDTLLGTNATDNLSSTYQKMADEIKEDVVSKMNAIQSDDAFVKVDALSAKDKDASIASKLESLNSRKLGDATIANARVVSQDAKGWTASYEVIKEGKVARRVNQQIDWTVDDAGSLIAKDEAMTKAFGGILGGKVLSPEVLLRGIDDSIVSDTTFGGMQSATLRKQLGEAFKATEKGFKGDKTAVDELLIAGDEAEVVFKPGDLLAGNVQTISGKRKFTLPEVKAYYAKRAFLDEAHKLQNHITKRKLEFQGFKEARWTNPSTGVEEIQIAKPFKDGRGFPNDSATNIIAPGLRGDKISITRANAIDIAESIQQGYVPVRFLNPIKIDGQLISHGLLPSAGKGKISKLPDNVLNKVDGYVPRISKPGYVYVKDAANGNKTVARFKSMDNAKIWADEQMLKQANESVPSDQRVSLQAVRDRDFSAADAINEDASSFGGLYTGARNKSGIFTGDDLASEVTRLSAGQSINRMVDNIANTMPLNEYRIAVVKKWKESAKQALKNQGLPSDAPIFRQIDSADEWRTTDLSIINDPATKNMLNAHREYMFNSLRIPHTQENIWGEFIMDIADNIPNGKTRNMLVNIASRDPVQSLKGATFDAYLGWFNPRQLYVQMQNASLAMSMYPTRAPAALSRAFSQRLFLYTPTVDKKLLKQASDGVLSPKELDDAVLSLEQFKKSGLRDSVMRTGDYDSNLSGFSTGTMEGYRKIAGKGRIFFEEGESMSRLITWNIARKNWLDTNPGRAMDDAALRSIADDTLRMNMNMQRENAAWWQKNAFTAIPTQFLQVQAKLIENTVGGILGNGKWTRAEASKVLAGQIALYGTAGVPIASSVSEAFKEGVGGGDQLAFAQDNPKLNNALDQGMVGTFSKLLGFENNFSEAGSILAGLDDNVVVDLMSTVGKLATGESQDISFSAPSIGVVQRGTDAMITAYEAARDMAVAPSVQTMGDSIWKAVDGVASIASTWSNARKIYFLEKLGGIPDKRGNITISAENLEGTSLQSQMAAAMGFTFDIQQAYYEQKLWKFDRKKLEIDTRKDLKHIYLEYKRDGNLEKFKANQALLLSPFQEQGGKVQEIMNSFIESISSERSSLDREVLIYMKDYVKSGGKIGTKAYQATFISGEE